MLEFHLCVTRMYSYVIRMSLVYSRMSSVCQLYENDTFFVFENDTYLFSENAGFSHLKRTLFRI